MDIAFFDERDDPESGESLVELARIAMVAEELPDTTELSLTLVDEARMRELNTEFMGKDAPTDVLSFPIEDFSAGIAPTSSPGPPLMLGDVVVCPSVVRANAEAAGVPFEDEMALMVVHGILHLLGQDHVIEAEAEQMEQREREILSLVGRERP
ncbi:MAG: rRNA maturation RNase YbeY [Acidimicrobiia bacterium]|nr:rRNA maturation RNase YbeY [Acidimicrobiia bacterium]